MVPEELRDIFAPLIDEHAYSDEEKSLVKQADALCAYLKCLEELAAGNNEFLLAKTRLEATLEARRSRGDGLLHGSICSQLPSFAR